MTKQLPDHPQIEPLSRTQVLMTMGITAIILLVIVKLWIQFGSISLLPVRWTQTSVPLGLGIGFVITVTSSIIYRFWAAYRQSADFYLDLILKPLVWPDLIWLGLLPGLSEELLFRGVMLPAIGLNVTGIVISAICFGILHLSGADHWPYAVWATVVGLLLGYVAVETQNLLVPIVAHIATNLVSSCLWKWDSYKKVPPPI